MNRSEDLPGPPYLRIVDEIRRRIASGELPAGARIPSARQITREWGVAIATATKALAALGQAGLVRPVPGVGTVVLPSEPAGSAPPGGGAAPAARTARRGANAGGARAGEEPDRDRVVRAAIGIADAEGLAALSMRRVAAELGLPTMSLYRYVAGKDELVLLMSDAAIGETRLPEAPPPGWRAQLELAARVQWAGYRRHPWLPHSFSMTRPQMQPNGVAHTEWALRALDGLGLDPNTMLHAAVTLAGFVRGLATSLEPEAQARAETGITDEEWMDSQDRAVDDFLAAGPYPTFTRLMSAPGLDLDLDTLFEFGLRQLLDGLATLIGRAQRNRE